MTENESQTLPDAMILLADAINNLARSLQEIKIEYIHRTIQPYGTGGWQPKAGDGLQGQL